MNLSHRMVRAVMAPLVAVASVLTASVRPACAQECVTGRWETPTPHPSLDIDAVYDSERDVTVMFGGRANSTTSGALAPTAETWEWDGTTWRRAAQTGPSPRVAYDGVVDFIDYLEFLNLFDAGDPAADLNRDGVVDFADYLEFLNFFEGEC